MKNSSNPSTVCVHAGKLDIDSTGVNTPIFTSSAHRYQVGQSNVYPRYFNTPNQEVVVQKLAQLEHTEMGLVLASGMAAISTAILSFVQAGDHVILQSGLYGGTYHFINSEFPRLGIEFTFLSDNQVDVFEKHIRPNTKVVYLETPSNPLLKITDIQKLAELCQKYDLISMIDNTFASPINQTPADFGIDIVLHSGTKYLGGHSDICFGAILGSENHISKVHQRAINFGGSLDAQTCYLIERSLKTLALRVEKQTENAMQIAHFLSDCPQIKTVSYPGLSSHPGHEIARQQMHGFGAMLSFELVGNHTKTSQQFAESLEIICTALSLGGIESTVSVSALTSHAKMTPEQRQAEGVSDDLLRLSVGIENVNDLIMDLKTALDKW